MRDFEKKSGIKPFSFAASLPSAFDDALTVIENINGIIHKLNVITKSYNSLVDYINSEGFPDNLQETFENLTNPFIEIVTEGNATVEEFTQLVADAIEKLDELDGTLPIQIVENSTKIAELDEKLLETAASLIDLINKITAMETDVHRIIVENGHIHERLITIETWQNVAKPLVEWLQSQDMINGLQHENFQARINSIEHVLSNLGIGDGGDGGGVSDGNILSELASLTTLVNSALSQIATLNGKVYDLEQGGGVGGGANAYIVCDFDHTPSGTFSDNIIWYDATEQNPIVKFVRGLNSGQFSYNALAGEITIGSGMSGIHVDAQLLNGTSGLEGGDGDWSINVLLNGNIVLKSDAVYGEGNGVYTTQANVSGILLVNQGDKISLQIDGYGNIAVKKYNYGSYLHIHKI